MFTFWIELAANRSEVNFLPQHKMPAPDVIGDATPREERHARRVLMARQSEILTFQRKVRGVFIGLRSLYGHSPSRVTSVIMAFTWPTPKPDMKPAVFYKIMQAGFQRRFLTGEDRLPRPCHIPPLEWARLITYPIREWENDHHFFYVAAVLHRVQLYVWSERDGMMVFSRSGRAPETMAEERYKTKTVDRWGRGRPKFEKLCLIVVDGNSRCYAMESVIPTR